MKIGHGYDVHEFAENRKLMLGGVEIDYPMGLAGHSDADVVLHAVCDAILGALGLGDIGCHFPDTDARYAGISSTLLLAEVCRMMTQHGFIIGNLDVTIVAQAPRLANHIPQMKDIISDHLACPVGDLNIKATTTEGLGFVGARLGIETHAVVVLKSAE